MNQIVSLFIISFYLIACTNSESSAQQTTDLEANQILPNEETHPISDSTSKTIHVLVALCDNIHQGIVPVPASMGNGQDPKSNLYWGAAYGIKTYFQNSKEWQLLEQKPIDSSILERLIFKHSTKNVYLIADAYNGKEIKQATKDFLQYSAGHQKNTVHVDEKQIASHGNANLIAYIGHDGLMDFSISETYNAADKKQRDVIILACYSQHYFQPHLQQSNVNPVLWTTGLMAPEAYSLHDALSGYVLDETNSEIQLRAAKAYSKYQKCSVNAAKRLLATSPDASATQ